MPRLPVGGEAPPDRAAARNARHANRLGVVGSLMLAPIALIFGLGVFMAIAHSLRR